MEDVSLIEYDRARLPEIEWTRLNEHYRYAVSLAQLVLRHCAFELPVDESGRRVHASSFLVDMDPIRRLRASRRTRETGAPRKGLPERGQASSTNPRRPRRRTGTNQTRARSLLVGGPRLHARRRHQIQADRTRRRELRPLPTSRVHRRSQLSVRPTCYAAGENAPATHVVRHLDRTLEVVTLDLAGTPDQLLDGMATVARRIAHQRTRNKRALARAA